jgi:hypothetical protein
MLESFYLLFYRWGHAPTFRQGQIQAKVNDWMLPPR